MLRGEGSGRVPFALVAVLLLLSAGVSAMYAAKLGRDEADARLREARLAALRAVADDVHREVLSQAQYVALGAIARGMDGLLNETKAVLGFRSGFADFLAANFPRIVRGVTVSVSAYAAEMGLAQRRIDDQVPSNATRVEAGDGFRVETPDLAAPEVIAPVDRLAYFNIHGFVDYTLTLDGVALRRSAPLYAPVPVPAPLMESKLEQAVRSGQGDLTGVGRTVKAILASVVQFRVLDGMASPAKPTTTTRDVLTRKDVELAVNLALLLEEVRRFRAYDRDAARSIDAVHTPPTPERTLLGLLDRYAAGGTLDATDLYVLYRGLDAKGLSLTSLLAQAIAAIQDELALKAVDYLGLTPVLDFLNAAGETASGWVDGFWRWATDRPSAQVEYVHNFLGAVFVDTGIGTPFYGPLDFPLPTRTYRIPNGTDEISISIPAHGARMEFPQLDLTSRALDETWEAYFPNLEARVGAVDASLRGMVNDIAWRIATDANLAKLLPGAAVGVVDPKDNVSFLDALGTRVGEAVDEALGHLRTNPYAIEAMMAALWEATKALLGDLVDFLIDGYDVFPVFASIFFRPDTALRDDLEGRARQDPRYGLLNESQVQQLRDAIAADVDRNRWAAAAVAARREADLAKWRRALDLADGTTQPGAHLRGQVLAQVLGAAGWLARAGDVIKHLMAEAVRDQDLAATRAVYRTSAEPFTLRDPGNESAPATERFRVRQSPPYLRSTPGFPGAPEEGELRVLIVDPADLPPDDSPNVHYTNPFEPSRRPFTTEWTVLVSGAVRLRVETEAAVLLGPDGLEPAGVEKTWPIEFAFAVPAYSGWNLAGVRYRNSDSLLTAVASFLDRALEALLPVLRWVLDVFRKALEVLRDFVSRILDFVHKVVRFLSDLFSRLVDVFWGMAMGALSVMGTLLDAALSLLPFGVHVPLRLGGIGFDLLVKGDNGRLLTIAFDLMGHGEVTFLKIDESEFRSRPHATDYDVLGSWDAIVGSLYSHAAFDPVLLTQAHMVEGTAAWEGAWRATFYGPERDSAFSLGPSVGFTVVLPEGTVIDLEAGIDLLLSAEPAFDAAQAVLRAIEVALAEAGTIRSWKDIGRVARVVARHVEMEILDLVEATVIEVGVSLELKVSEAEVGGGVRLALVAEGTAVRLLLEWVVDKIAALFEHGFNPFAATGLARPPVEILEHAWVRVDAFFSLSTPAVLANFGVKAEVRAAAEIQPNLAAIGRLMGWDLGRPEVRFAALVDGEVKVGWLGPYHAVYLLQGSVVFP